MHGEAPARTKSALVARGSGVPLCELIEKRHIPFRISLGALNLVAPGVCDDLTELANYSEKGIALLGSNVRSAGRPAYLPQIDQRHKESI